MREYFEALRRSYADLPPVTRFCFDASVVGYLLVMAFPISAFYLGMVPHLVWHRFWIWQLFTYMFLHGSFFHIFFNGFMLWTLGGEMERRFGSSKYLRYALFTGIGAALFDSFILRGSIIPVIGISGVIYGLLFAYAYTSPNAVLYLYFAVPIKAKHLVWLLGFVEFYASLKPQGGIANLAHLGGLLAGALYLWLWPKLTALRLARKEERREDDAKYMDELLAKISRDGINSLTESEKKFLDRRSGR